MEAPANEPVADAALTSSLASLVGTSNVANLTAIIQQIVQTEIQKILMNLQAVKNFTINAAQAAIGSDEPESKPVAVVVKEEKPVITSVESNKKPVYFLPRRPGYFPHPHPYYFGSQQPMPYYNEQPYPLYRREGAYGDRWSRVNPTSDESLSDLEALAELELLLDGKEDVISEAEARGIMSSLSSTTNSAKASFKSFVQSLRSIPSALPSAFPSFSIVKKTYLVPGLAISGKA